MASGKAINQYNEFVGNADAVNVLVQETSQSDPNTYEHKKANLAVLIKTVASVDDYVEGYYYNGAFYTDSAHTTAIVPTTGRLYGDLTTGTGLYRWNGSAYVQLTPDLTPYATKAEMEAADTDLKSALQDSEQRIENLEQAVSGSLVTTNTDATQKNTKTITNANTILPWALLNRVGARAVAWNQLFNSDTAQVITPSTYNIFKWADIVPNHVYLVTTQTGICTWQLWESETKTYDWTISGNNRNVGYFDSTVGAYIIKPTTYKYFCMRNQLNTSVLTENKNWQPMLFDLTAMGEYDSTKTDAENIANFKAKYPASYYTYNAGQIIDVPPMSFLARGKNLFDQEVALGYYSTSTGEFVSAPTVCIACKNKIRIEPNKTYYFKCSTIAYGYYYGADGSYLGTYFTMTANASFTTLANAYYMTFNCDSSYGLVYNHDIQICANSLSDKATFHDYNGVEIDTSFMAGKKYINPSCHDYSENVYEGGILKRKEHIVVGQVDLGTLSWTWDSSYWEAPFSLAKLPSTSDVKGNIVHAIYENRKASGFSATGDNGIALPATTVLRCKTTSSSVLPTGILYYELVTPTTSLHNDPIPNFPSEDGTTITAITPQTELVNAIDVPTTIAYMTKIGA